MATPSHLKVVFVRNTYVRKEHIAGEQAAQTKTDLMTIVRAGEAKGIVYHVAMDLIVGGSVLIDNANNKEAIAEIREAAQKQEAREKKKAA